MEEVPVVQGVPVKEDEPRAVPSLREQGVRFVTDDDVQPVSERDGPIALLSNDVEPHVLLSAVILVCSVGCDALTAIDVQPGRVDSPSSMRVCSLVVVVILSSPVLKGVNLVDQRALIALILLVVSFFGLHEASEETRTGDCVFITLVMLATVYICHTGGIEPDKHRPDKQANQPHRRQTVAALCGALFFYSGIRGLRAAFVSSEVASTYKVEYESAAGPTLATGYAFVSTDTTVPLGFAHGVSICVGLLILLHDDARVVGSSAVAYEVGACGLAILVAATWALIGTSRPIESLQILYGAGACRGDVTVCYESARARRLVMANNNTGSAWLTGLAAVSFSFAIERRFIEVKTRAESMWKRKGVGFSLAVLVTSVVAVFNYSTFEGEQVHTDIILIVSLFAIFVSATTDTFIGTLVYAIAMSYEQVELLNNYGSQFIFIHLTHITLFVSLLLMWMWIAFMAFKEFMVLGCGFGFRDDSVVNRAIGTLAAAGTSLTFGLFVASALLLAASNGGLPQEDDVFRGGSPTRSMLAFALCHFVPFMIWVPTFVCRCEVLLISSWSRTIAWLAAVPVDALIYVMVLSSLGQSAPTAVLMQVSGVSVVGVAALAAWALGGFV